MDSQGESGYLEQAKELHGAGRFEEAAAAAHTATSLDPQNADAWWLLGLALRDRDGHGSGINAFQRVTELEPNFSGGWFELGSAYHASQRREEAITSYEQALAIDPEHLPAMQLLALALKGVDAEGVPARRLALLRMVDEKNALDADDLFEFALLLSEQGAYAEALGVYQRYTDAAGQHASVAYFNQALCYQLLDRDLDAWDALHTAQRNGYQGERLERRLADVRGNLQRLRLQVVDGPEMLAQEDWFQHYVNPFTLLDVRPEDVSDNPKALQKARQALLHEIELEEGRVSWLPGLFIDKSAALVLLAELDTTEGFVAHSAVYNSPGLNDFLSKGSLAHFLVAEDESSEAVLPYEISEKTLAIIGPKFALQFDKVLSQAIEQRNLPALRCLLNGRRWVLPSQQEACWTSSKRVVMRLCEPLCELAKSDILVGLPETQAVFREDKFGELLALLPVEFHEAHTTVSTVLRDILRAYYPREMDMKAAQAILELGRACAYKLPSLTHQFEQDAQTIQEELDKEAHLHLNDKSISITRAGVVFGDQHLAPKDIVGVRWGMTLLSERPRTIQHNVGFEARRGPNLEVKWVSSVDLDAQRDFWCKLADATMAFILPDVQADFTDRLERREPTKVGPLMVTKEGVELTTKGWFSEKRRLVEWPQLKGTLSDGALILQDALNPKTMGVLPMNSTYNAPLLFLITEKNGNANP
ncbi:tetratricopeptide repeat protein [Comamonas sp. 17RB]|uniref:tetratricopeptide repeat protein n=1 Tax=Comamonas sp. 17RB TaxID=3047025 RepID=UPI0024B716CB|nr:tetratricopeptide repeat protein [Comamonas sp. 17RB]MDI9855537.1 tetratricopeptide repeat protein [Comamonas sp. 17RB]